MKISQREYARRKGISSAYVSKLAGRGVITTDADGKVDEQSADEARRRYTVVGRGKRRWERRHGDGLPLVAICVGCGGRFSPVEARGNGSLDPMSFCEDHCADDVREGKSRKEIHARIKQRALDTGSTRAELKRPDFFDWVLPNGAPNVPQ